MSQINEKSSKVVRERTHGGAPATRVRVDAVQKLRRSVLSTLLWEDQFYEGGQSIADRIAELSSQVSPAELSSLAIEARSVHNLRHIPLQLTVNLVRHRIRGKLLCPAVLTSVRRSPACSLRVSSDTWHCCAICATCRSLVSILVW